MNRYTPGGPPRRVAGPRIRRRHLAGDDLDSFGLVLWITAVLALTGAALLGWIIAELITH